MNTVIDLYKSCIVSSLLTTCGTWTEITEEEIKQLLRAAFRLVSLKFRVMEVKVLLVLAIRSQEEGGPAREILEEQPAMGFPGLGQEVRQISVELGLPDATRMDVQKEQVSEAIQVNSLKELEAAMTVKIKLKELTMCDLRQPQS